MKVEIDKGNYACAGDSMTATDNTIPVPPEISAVIEAFDELGVLLDTETVTNFVRIPDPVDQIFEACCPSVSDSGPQADENGTVDAQFAWTTTVTHVSCTVLTARADG